MQLYKLRFFSNVMAIIVVCYNPKDSRPMWTTICNYWALIYIYIYFTMKVEQADERATGRQTDKQKTQS